MSDELKNPTSDDDLDFGSGPARHGVKLMSAVQPQIDAAQFAFQQLVLGIPLPLRGKALPQVNELLEQLLNRIANPQVLQAIAEGKTLTEALGFTTAGSSQALPGGTPPSTSTAADFQIEAIYRQLEALATAHGDPVEVFMDVVEKVFGPLARLRAQDDRLFMATSDLIMRAVTGRLVILPGGKLEAEAEVLRLSEELKAATRKADQLDAIMTTFPDLDKIDSTLAGAIRNILSGRIIINPISGMPDTGEEALQDEIKRLNRENSDLKGKLDKAETDRDDASKQLTEAHQTVSDLQQENKQLTNDKAAAERKLATIDGELTQAKSQAEARKTTLASRDQKISDLQKEARDQKTRLEGEIDNLNDELTDIRRQLATAQGNAADPARLTQLNRRVGELEKEAEAKERRITQLTDDLKQADQLTDQHAAIIKDLAKNTQLRDVDTPAGLRPGWVLLVHRMDEPTKTAFGKARIGQASNDVKWEKDLPFAPRR